MTNRSRGFGFVWFSTEDDQSRAISEMHKTVLSNREISVTAAIPQSQTAPGTPASALGRGGAGRHERRHDRRPYDRG